MKSIDKQFSELQKKCKETNNEIEKLKREAAYEIKRAVVQVTEEELEDIKAEMCDNYCSKRKEWTGDPDDFIEEICVNCPLTRL